MSGIKPAASLILCRRMGPGKGEFQVLMAKRSAKGTFKSLHVYPGGAVDGHDTIFARTLASASEKSNLSLSEYRLAAVRETFEESGLLLGAPAQAALEAASTWRAAVHANAAQFATMCSSLSYNPPLFRLVHWSHWITPIVEKRRFDTHFFLTTFTGHHDAAADGRETVLQEWIRPADALRAFADGDISLFPPQYTTLRELACLSFEDVQAFVDGTRVRDPARLVPCQPEPHVCDVDGNVMLLPGDWEHPITREYAGTALRHVGEGAKNRIRFLFGKGPDNQKVLKGFQMITTGGNDGFGAARASFSSPSSKL
ncbi:hypothetical protein BC830DRAFT_1068547 [Chytriomyces sp. MP71]|nr:hypothetical protein BC830DRAFT_1068547 [Chytriomyces sp. MP71]